VVDETWLDHKGARQGREGALGRPSTREEVEMIEEALAASRGRVAGRDGAAARLGVPRSTLESKIRSLRIDKHQFASPDSTDF
jgi:formate hydrogenlyase transcriptional activator